MKDLLRQVFARTIADLDERLRTWVPRCRGAAEQQLAAGGDVVVLAFGKAARAMATAYMAALPPGRVRGLLVPTAGDEAPLPPLEVIPGGHPLPDEGSFRAAQRALALCRTATPRDHVTYLISGGGSAMLELPIDATVGVVEWRAFHARLVGCGAPIDRINRIRRRLSAVKGGRLAVAAAAAASQTSVVVKDVPGPVDDVASGPTSAFDDEPDTLLADLREWNALHALPAGLRAAVENGSLPRSPAIPGPMPTWITVLDEAHARRSFVAQLISRGFHVRMVRVDDWPCERAADVLLRRLDRLRRRHPGRDVAIVTTGELSVPLPPSPGLGGRNQQFALACARRIRGRPITVLSCGTDGIDGNSPAAGAVVDGTTIARSRVLGFSVHDALRHCDAFPLLHALGDTVITGPTGTNVRDLRVLVHAR